MTFRITGLDPAPFRHLFGLPDDDLAALGVSRMVADAHPGYPDRIELRDAQPGETLLLLNFEHQPAPTAYRSRHAIFVIEGAGDRFNAVVVVPEVLKIRPMSLRAFTCDGEMVDADLADGTELVPLIERLLADPRVDYLQAHYARRGCYAARIDRA